MVEGETLFEAKYSRKHSILSGDKEKRLNFAKILKAKKTLSMESYDPVVESANTPCILTVALLDRT